MGILNKCEKVGLELRRTEEGRLAFDLFSQLQDNECEFLSEFFVLINKDYLKLHFFAVPNSLEIFKHNTENKHVGKIAKEIINIKGIEDFAKSNIALGKFVDEFSKSVFGKAVHYDLPNTIKATPELIRITNTLSVECQKVNIVQAIMKEYYSNPMVTDMIARFDELRGSTFILPYSKEDRRIYKILKKEYPHNNVQAFCDFINIQIYIRSMIFDSFYGNIFELKEGEECTVLREAKLNGCTYVKIKIESVEHIMDFKLGWILKFERSDNTIVYAQIFKKTTNFPQETAVTTIIALIIDIL